MDGTPQRHPLTDSQLDRELEAALGVEPSPEFLARVRTRVTSEPEPMRWRLDVVSAFRRRSFEPLWAVGIAGIVLAIVVPQFMRDEIVHPQRDVTQVARQTAAGRAEEEGARSASPHSSSRPAAPLPGGREAQRSSVQRVLAVQERLEPRTIPLQLSPVLIAENERLAFEFFVAAVNRGQVPEEAIAPAPSGTGDVPALLIEPLAITPMASLARVAQQGEDQWE